jgi:hypothetical protein
VEQLPVILRHQVGTLLQLYDSQNWAGTYLLLELQQLQALRVVTAEMVLQLVPARHRHHR